MLVTKFIHTLLLVLLTVTAYGQSNLPACQGLDVSKWSYCQGNFAAQGDKYIGEFKDGRFNGQGTYIFENGNKYVGNFRDNKLHGHGIYTYANGNQYVGEHLENKSFGQGTYTFVSGNKYVGEVNDGKAHGQGIYYRSNGDVALGEWKEGKPDGLHIEYHAGKTVKRSGIFKDGNLVSSEYIDPNSFTRIARNNIVSLVSDTQQKNKESNSLNMDNAKSKCEELGFKTTTEGFGKCVLQLTK